jgi:hypothetical protein
MSLASMFTRLWSARHRVLHGLLPISGRRVAGADYTILRWFDATRFVLAKITHSATHSEQAPRQAPAEEAPAPRASLRPGFVR